MLKENPQSVSYVEARYRTDIALVRGWDRTVKLK